MNKLVEIFIRWFCHKIALHTDVTKMYNAVKLRQDQWCYQRYLWNDTLDVDQPPEEKVIKTLIYGVKSSGNQAERGLRETAKLSKDEYPEVSEIINNDVLVDDCISGEERTVIPADAVNLKINTVDFGDASKSMAAIAIYARLLRKNGEFSSQLIFGRSKIISVPTQPRAELEAALLNSHTGEVIKRSLKSNYDGSLKLTDSTIVLHWISNDDIQLK